MFRTAASLFVSSAIFAWAVCSGSGAAQTLSQSLPNGLLTTEGNNSSSYPWAAATPNAWHFNYDTSNFVANFPIIITALYVRANGGATAAGGTHPSVDVTMASSLVDWSTTGSTTVLAAVMDIDATLVYSGPFTMPGGTQPTPAPWVPLGPITPFYYDPTLGKDFIIEVRTHGPNTAIMSAVDLHSNGAAQRYGSQTSSTITVANFSNVNIVPVVMIDYVPAAGIFGNFTGTPVTGTAPLTVNFTDGSFTSDPGGITSWSWDFENDGIIDSTAQNPSFTYLSPGDYTVSLTVTDAAFPPGTVTKTNYVHVDQYVFDAVTTGNGVGDLVIFGIPQLGGPTATQGFTFVSATPAATLGGGSFFGIQADAMTWPILQIPAIYQNPLHFIYAPGLFPNTPYGLQAGTLSSLAGTTLDLVQVGLTPTYGLVFVSNVDRITF